MTKFLKKSSLIKEIFILAQFQRFQFKVSWLHCFGPEARQNTMAAEAHGKGNCSTPGSQETQRKCWGRGYIRTGAGNKIFP
jgi:hypothetical protein